MYESFYGLKRPAFHITPDPEFLFLTPSNREALASIIYGVEKRKGFVVIIGEVGVGKTTILRSYLEKVDRQRLRIVYIFNANLSFQALLKTMYQELGLETKTEDVFEMVNGLHQALIREYQQGRNVVLVIDEAQNMPVETLENLRMLSNLETSTDKLIQIVLVGQPEFARKLDLNKLRQLRQRIAIRSTISPFTGKESLADIEHRLAKAGAHGTSGVFTRGALRRIITQARGIPRTLNILCDNGLITGFGYQKKPVTARIVKEVIGDFEGKTKSSLLKWVPVPLAAVLIISGLLIFSPYGDLLLSKLEGLQAFRIPQLAPVRSAPEPSRSPASLPQAGQEPVTREQVPPPEEKKVPEVPKKVPTLTRTVKTGDTLYRLTEDVYGFTNRKVIEQIRESNPNIKNVNKILIGTRIHFPEISGGQAR